MNRREFLTVLPLTGLASEAQAALAPLLLQDSQYQFRVTVDLISLNVTVTDTSDNFVTSLAQGNFRVFEDGILQEISVFSREDLPLRMVFLLDTSASMDRKIGAAHKAATGFVDTLKDDDLAQVIEFGSRARILQAFTGDRMQLNRAIRMTQAGGTTHLHDALYLSLKNLARRRQDIRRQAVVVLSDGEDTSSLVSFDQVMDLAKETDVTIYTISLRTERRRKTRSFSEAEFVLKKLAEETGGRWFFPKQIQELDSVYERISTELKSQYNIGYESNNARRDGSWRRVVVQTDQENLLVRAKLGYYAPKDGA